MAEEDLDLRLRRICTSSRLDGDLTRTETIDQNDDNPHPALSNCTMCFFDHRINHLFETDIKLSTLKTKRTDYTQENKNIAGRPHFVAKMRATG